MQAQVAGPLRTTETSLARVICSPAAFVYQAHIITAVQKPIFAQLLFPVCWPYSPNTWLAATHGCVGLLSWDNTFALAARLWGVASTAVILTVVLLKQATGRYRTCPCCQLQRHHRNQNECYAPVP